MIANETTIIELKSWLTKSRGAQSSHKALCAATGRGATQIGTTRATRDARDRPPTIIDLLEAQGHEIAIVSSMVMCTQLGLTITDYYCTRVAVQRQNCSPPTCFVYQSWLAEPMYLPPF